MTVIASGVGLLAVRDRSPKPPSSSTSWRTPVKFDRDIAGLLDFDHHLLQADLLGVFEVLRINQPSNETVVVEVSPVDIWFARSNASEVRSFWVRESEWSRYRELLTPGSKVIAFASGGPSTESVFTYGTNSVFKVDGDVVRCASGNTVYGVLTAGVVCSEPSRVMGKAISTSEMKSSILAARENAVARHQELAAALDHTTRTLTVPSADHVPAEQNELSTTTTTKKN